MMARFSSAVLGLVVGLALPSSLVAGWLAFTQADLLRAWYRDVSRACVPGEQVAVRPGDHDAPRTVCVAMAARDLPAGTVIRAEDVRPRFFLPKFIPADARPDPVGATTHSRILAGELIRTERLR